MDEKRVRVKVSDEGKRRVKSHSFNVHKVIGF